MNGISGHADSSETGSANMSTEVLDLETFTHCAPILLSDHEPQITRLYEVLMSRMRLSTVSVPDGADALEYALNKPVSLVISDILKPTISGLDMLKALRADATTSGLPFMVITANPQCETRLAFNALGGNAYLTKPLNTQQFSQTIVDLLTAQLVNEPVQ